MAKFKDNGKSFKVLSPIDGQGNQDLANFAKNGESSKVSSFAKMERGSWYKVLSWIEPSFGSHRRRNPKSSPEFLFWWEPTKNFNKWLSTDGMGSKFNVELTQGSVVLPLRVEAESLSLNPSLTLCNNFISPLWCLKIFPIDKANWTWTNLKTMVRASWYAVLLTDKASWT